MSLAIGEDMANDLTNKLLVDDTHTGRNTVSTTQEEGKEAVRDEESEKEVKTEEAMQKEGAEAENDRSSDDGPKLLGEAEEILTEVDPKTGIAFPIKLYDRMQLNAVGLRKKNVLGIGIKIYSFGIYADNMGLKEVLKSKIGEAPEKPTKNLYEAIIDCDVRLMVRLVIVFGGLTMSMVRKSFDESLNVSLKMLNGGQKNEELVKQVMGKATDSIKLPAKAVIEITRLPGFVLQAKVKGEILSSVTSELLCRAYFHLYLGEEPFDKEARDRFGVSMLSLF